MKTLSLLCLLPVLAAATPIQYTLGDHVVSLIAPDFLPNLPHQTNDLGEMFWHFVKPQMQTVPCSEGMLQACADIFFSYKPMFGESFFSMTLLDSVDHVAIPGISFLYQTDLAHIGTFGYQGNYQFPLTVQYSDAAVTYAPEPKSWWLAAVGLALSLIWHVKRAASSRS